MRIDILENPVTQSTSNNVCGHWISKYIRNNLPHIVFFRKSLNVLSTKSLVTIQYTQFVVKTKNLICSKIGKNCHKRTFVPRCQIETKCDEKK